MDKRETQRVQAQSEWKARQEQASTEEAYRLAERSIRSANLATRLAAFSLQSSPFHASSLCKMSEAKQIQGPFRNLNWGLQ